MVGEGIVLLGVQNFQQSGGWIALKIRTEFIDFIQHEDRINRPGFAHGLQNAAGQRAKIRPAVPRISASS
jgi:hypothetical protein